MSSLAIYFVKVKYVLSLSLCLCALSAFAQTPPDTEIFVFNLKEKKGEVSLEKGKNVTNHKGYDSQPYFHGINYMLYTEEEKGQTDIMMIDLLEGKKTNLTDTKESEYSPAMIPGYDSFATIRVEEDGTQRLWQFHLNSKKEPQLIFEDLALVGYHVWSGSDVVMFILGSPVKMIVANTQELNERNITDNIERTLRLIPGTKYFAFERKEASGKKIIYRLDKETTWFELIKINQKVPATGRYS